MLTEAADEMAHEESIAAAVEKASTAGIDVSTKVVIPHVSSMAVA